MERHAIVLPTNTASIPGLGRSLGLLSPAIVSGPQPISSTTKQARISNVRSLKDQKSRTDPPPNLHPNQLIRIVAIQVHDLSQRRSQSEQTRLEIRRAISRAPAGVDVDCRRAQEVLRAHFGDGGSESGLDGWQTGEVGQRASVVCESGGREDLR